MNIWPVQDAKARFSAMLDACMTRGPQIVTKRGAEAAVLVPVAEWKRLKEGARPTLKDVLLSEAVKGDLGIPPRSAFRHRPAPEL